MKQLRPRRPRRDATIDRLPEDLRLTVRRMMISGDPHFTLQEIQDALHKQAREIERSDALDPNKENKFTWPLDSKGERAKSIVSISALSRYYHSHLAVVIEESKRRVAESVAIADAVYEQIGNHRDDPPEYVRTLIQAVIDSGILANRQDLEHADPTTLLLAKTALERTEIARNEVGLKQRRLDMQREQWRLKAKKMEAELEARRREDERRKAEAEKALQAAPGATLDEKLRAVGPALWKAYGFKLPEGAEASA